MDRAQDDTEKTLAEIHALTARLTALLQEAEALRARVGKARGANVWPDVPPGFWLTSTRRQSRRPQALVTGSRTRADDCPERLADQNDKPTRT